MALFKQDEVVVRQLRHAHQATARLRDAQPLAAEVLDAGLSAADALWSAAIDLQAEAADDAPTRALRDDAATELLERIAHVLRRFRALVTLASTDETGAVTDPDSLRRAEGLLDTFLPDGRPSSLRISGYGLLLDAQNIREGIANFDATAELATRLDPTLHAFEAALADVDREDRELDQARRRLDDARDQALQALLIARAYVDFAALHHRDLQLDPRRIFPVPPRRNRPTEDAAALDDAGVEPLPPTPEPTPAVDPVA